MGDSSSPPTFAYLGNKDISLATITQNAFDTLLTNVSIATQYSEFDIPFQADQGKTLQFCVYLGLALSIYTAFFALYPCQERLKNVRALHYSNGVRALPLWLAYIAWDFSFVLAGSVISIIILRGRSDVWYNLGDLFVVLFLFGLASTLYSYVVSLFSKSQVSRPRTSLINQPLTVTSLQPLRLLLAARRSCFCYMLLLTLACSLMVFTPSLNPLTLLIRQS